MKSSKPKKLFLYLEYIQNEMQTSKKSAEFLLLTSNNYKLFLGNDYSESARSRWLRGNVDYVGAWVAWVRGCVGCVGQIFTWVAWVTWVKIFFTWVLIFPWVAWVKLFLCGSKFFCMSLFVGQNFLGGSNNFCPGQFLGVSLKKVSIGAFTIIS